MSRLNCIGKSSAEIGRALRSFVRNTALDLSENELGNLSADELKIILTALPDNITTLDLSWNGLSKFSANEWRTILAALPKGISSLNLSGNRLGQFSVSEFKGILCALSQNMLTLDLGRNELEKFSSEVLKNILRVLPSKTKVEYIVDRNLTNTLPYVSPQQCHKTATTPAMVPSPGVINEISSVDSQCLPMMSYKKPRASITMSLLSCFIAAMGIAAVALAFIVLNAATFGAAGIVVATVGVVAMLSGGLGLFKYAPDIKKKDEPRLLFATLA